MFPLIPTLALAVVSFICSAFVILRIVVPILPPSPLSRRVPPSEFGLPNFKSISPADKSHLWLAACDIVALAVFVWEAVNEFKGGSAGYSIANDPGSAVRLWIAMTLRQTCLFVVSGLTLLHVRMGRSVEFGRAHWMLWAPTLLLAATSTTVAGVLAATTVKSFFLGLVGYSTGIALVSSIAFGCLIGTLAIIKRNLLHDIRDPWPPAKEAQVETKARPSFATEDIDALKDGSSWITSRASSRAESISAFSFSTHHTHHTRHSARPSNDSANMLPHPAVASYPSIPPKSSFWFSPTSPPPPVPPLPAPYRPTSTTSAHINADPDPFKKELPRARMGSQSSWLTEPSVYTPTLSTWSFPTEHGTPSTASLPNVNTELLPSTAVSRPTTPAMANAEVLGGYGYTSEGQAENGSFGSRSSYPSSDLDVSVLRIAGWLASIWIPLGLSLPYMFMATPHTTISPVVSTLLMLSVTLSSPLLALKLLLGSPLPVPSELFETYSEPPSVVRRAPSLNHSTPSLPFSHEYKRSGSITVVEGRRSTDVWIVNGDAVSGKGKIGRALGLLSAKPKLAVLPPAPEKIQDAPITPPLPIQMEPNVPGTPRSEMSAELGRTPHRPRKESKASSYWSGASESAFATQILIAQRHYSAVATKMFVAGSPERRASMNDANIGAASSGVETPSKSQSRRSQHLRVRSASSITGPDGTSRFPVSPPPSSPLPPTPPSVRERKARLLSTHRRSHSHTSSAGFSFGPVAGDGMAEIDALSARVLPLLVPGLTVGSDMRVSDDWPGQWSAPSARANGGTMRSTRTLPMELGGFSADSSYPMESTPAEHAVAVAPREKKTSLHKRHHMSLPSFGLGKGSGGQHAHTLSAWRNDLNAALGQFRLSDSPPVPALPTKAENRRNTVYGYSGELVANAGSRLNLDAVDETDELLRPASPAFATENRASVGTFGQAVERAPTRAGTDTARNSLATLITVLDQELRAPPSAASDVTLFDPAGFDPAAFEDSEDGPRAESTPHEAQRALKAKKRGERVPPVPLIREGPPARRSSIRYIVSDENAPVEEAQRASISPKTFGAWTARAVRPLVPKSPKKAKKAGKVASPPGGGLRPLSLLQERDANAVRAPEEQGAAVAAVKPLSLSKRARSKLGLVGSENASPDENASPVAKKGLKPLKLTRSETTKERAILRNTEVLPNVVVRPPSQVERGVDVLGY